MSVPINESGVYGQLRKEAEARLEAGTAAASNWSLGVDALRMLHKLSSNPDTAADALKLLHELQVHQVELDLQSEAMRANEQGLVEDLFRYKGLYEFAPAGYFLVDYHGEIIEGNIAGAELLDVAHGQLTGVRIDQFLTPESRLMLSELLQELKKKADTRGLELTLDGKADLIQTLQVIARVSPDKHYVLLVCSKRA